MTNGQDKPTGDAPYRDATLDVDARVSDLLGRMTLEEKISQMAMIARFQDLLEGDQIPEGALRDHYGAISPGCIDDPRLEPLATAKAVNAVQSANWGGTVKPSKKEPMS